MLLTIVRGFAAIGNIGPYDRFPAQGPISDRPARAEEAVISLERTGTDGHKVRSYGEPDCRSRTWIGTTLRAW